MARNKREGRGARRLGMTGRMGLAALAILTAALGWVLLSGGEEVGPVPGTITGTAQDRPAAVPDE